MEHSRLAGVSARCRSAIAHAWIVRWLTKEPDPAVVVIDLAETRTVGPLLAVLDRIVDALATTALASGARRGARNVGRSLERNAVPALGGALLGLVIGTLALTWEGATLAWLGALAIAGVAGVLGLTVDRSRTALERSTAVNWLAAAIAPPDEDLR